MEKNKQKWNFVKYIYEIFGVMGDKMMIFRILKVSLKIFSTKLNISIFF